ncbi:MAG: AraC family transcriptional regulator [Paenibacillaceae bacterium]
MALQHGFSSSNYLYYVFRKRYGMTPNRYRITNRKDG